MRPTTAEINLEAIKNNIANIRKKVGPNIKIMAAVKANGYGHGAVEVSKAVLEGSGNMLGVATVDEGIHLRNAGFDVPIILLGAVFPFEVEEAVINDITISICTEDLLNETIKQAEKHNKKAPIYLLVDTGMGRVGVFPYENTLDYAKKIAASPNLNWVGMFSHFPISDEKEKSFSFLQIQRMNDILGMLQSQNIKRPEIVSMANSGAILDIPESYFDMVRPGIMTYGLNPSTEVSDSIKIEQAFSLKSKIVFTKKVPKGTSIGYGRTYYTKQDDSLIATIPIGYADGYRRAYANKAPILIGGKRYTISGRVSMDQITVDLGPDSNAQIGDEVVLIGKQGNEEITVMEMANLIHTITYEVTCGISYRVPRVYKM